MPPYCKVAGGRRELCCVQLLATTCSTRSVCALTGSYQWRAPYCLHSSMCKGETRYSIGYKPRSRAHNGESARSYRSHNEISCDRDNCHNNDEIRVSHTFLSLTEAPQTSRNCCHSHTKRPASQSLNTSLRAHTVCQRSRDWKTRFH